MPDAQAMFDVLTSQNRYALYHRLTAIKGEEARARRIDSFVAMLARGETVGLLGLELFYGFEDGVADYG